MEKNESILESAILTIGVSTAFGILLYSLGYNRGFNQGYRCGQSIGFINGSLATVETYLNAVNKEAAKVAEEVAK